MLILVMRGVFGKKSPQRTGAKCLLDRTMVGSHGEPQFEGIVTAQNRQSQSFGLGTSDPMIA